MGTARGASSDENLHGLAIRVLVGVVRSGAIVLVPSLLCHTLHVHCELDDAWQGGGESDLSACTVNHMDVMCSLSHTKQLKHRGVDVLR